FSPGILQVPPLPRADGAMILTSPPPAKLDLLSQLRERMEACCRASDHAPTAISTGIAALDGVLPHGGLQPGTLLQLLDSRTGSGASSLAMAITRATCAGAVVVLDGDRQFYPPAAVAWGLHPDRLVVIHPADEPAALWAAVQSLRCRAVGAVWLRCDR